MNRWEEYEQWVSANAAAICATLGFETDSMQFDTQVHMRGATLSHRVDILGKADERLIVIEVKDRHPLPRKEAMDAVYRVIDIANARPDVDVAGVLISSNPPGRAVRDIVSDVTGVFRTPANVVPPQHLVMTPPETVSDHILLRRYHGQNVTVDVIHRGRARDLEQLAHALVTEPVLEDRLGAALEVLANHRESSMAADAEYEAAICLLHLGAGRVVVDMHDQLVANTGASHTLEQTQLLLDMAFFQAALQGSGGTKPAKSVIQRLVRRLPTMTPGTRIGAKQFVGAWLGLYDDEALARHHLNESLTLAERASPTSAAYHTFMGRIRLAEIASSGERDEHLADAWQQLEMLDPLPRHIAREVYERVDGGRDASIASNFGSNERARRNESKHDGDPPSPS